MVSISTTLLQHHLYTSLLLDPYSSLKPSRENILTYESDLKSTTDDTLAPHLTTLPAPYTFTQDHTKSNIRFLLGYSAVAIAAFTFYADRTLKWEATQSPWIIAAVSAYFLLNSLLTVWVWFVEKGEVFRGKTAKGDVVCFFPWFWYTQGRGR